ncbi:M16 family metallopeptidase [Pseudogulbenkiania subflava]|uniref:Zinc protease n=1 Tax=Pseudogulbenkiania subflava DSM 22618 TaxID=1123014 RepID=A0A1Y6CEV0_9NEIS|nr:pitrilysin family protein [Pseudogulbenkiania subflava]SMF51917.1 zinc protease [Pseudogulbenkiania subflava DSM 22618]
MISRTLSTVAGVVFLGVCGVVSAEPVEAVLDNGMKIVVQRDERAPVAVSQLWYRVGSVDEVNGRTGLSHLLEHMMFKGTPTVPAGEFSRLIAQAGGKDNAFTSRDYTVYFQQLAADKLPLALKLEADRMHNLSFKDSDFTSELQVVKEERRMRTDDQPAGIMAETLFANAFVANPVRYPVIGWMDDLDHMKPDDLRQWYHHWYGPNNATLVVVGDVDPQAVIAEARRQFGPLKPVALPERRPQIEPEQKGERRVSVKAVSPLPSLTLAWQVPRLEKVDAQRPYALYMLSAILDGQAASRLPRRLVREQRVATEVSADYDMLGRGGALFSLSGVPAQGKALAQLEQALRQEMAHIARDGVSERELERVRLQLQAGRIYEKDSMFAQAMRIGNLESIGFSWRDDATIDANIAKVSAEQVRQAARSLVDDHLTVVTLLPQQGDKPRMPAMPQGDQTHVR